MSVGVFGEVTSSAALQEITLEGISFSSFEFLKHVMWRWLHFLMVVGRSGRPECERYNRIEKRLLVATGCGVSTKVTDHAV